MRHRVPDDSVTVVVPAYGAATRLLDVIDALKRQTRRADALIVVHSGGEDPTGDIVARYPQVTVLHHRAGLYAGAARNAGALAATSEWIAFIDDDVVPAPDWLASLLAAAAGAPDRFVVGAIASSGTGGYWGSARSAVEFSSTHPTLPPGPVDTGPGGNLLLRRDRLHQAGGFPQAFRASEDSLLVARLNRLGLAGWRCPAAMTEHCDTPGAGRFFRHLYLHGRWSALARRAEPALGGPAPALLWPLAPFLGVYRFAVAACRMLGHGRGHRAGFAVLTPGVLLGCLAWNVGFVAGLAARLPDATGGLVGAEPSQARISSPSGEAA